jgi:hypothetical protein
VSPEDAQHDEHDRITRQSCTSFVQLVLAVWNLVTGDVNPFILVAGSLALCAAAAAY